MSRRAAPVAGVCDPGPASQRPATGGRLRAVLLPHMDYARGNVTYGYGFKALFEAIEREQALRGNL